MKQIQIKSFNKIFIITNEELDLSLNKHMRNALWLNLWDELKDELYDELNQYI